MAEATAHPHNTARGVFAEVGGVPQPQPAPRFGRSTVDRPEPPRHPGADTDQVLAGDLALSADRIADLRAAGIIA